MVQFLSFVTSDGTSVCVNLQRLRYFWKNSQGGAWLHVEGRISGYYVESYDALVDGLVRGIGVFTVGPHASAEDEGS